MARPKAAKRRTTIGSNPLDALLPPAPQAEEEEAAPEERPPAPRRGRAKKERATYHLSSDLVEEVKDVVVALSGPPLRLTLAAFVENALKAEVERYKRERNKGRPFPKRESELRGGRPIGS